MFTYGYVVWLDSSMVTGPSGAGIHRMVTKPRDAPLVLPTQYSIIHWSSCEPNTVKRHLSHPKPEV